MFRILCAYAITLTQHAAGVDNDEHVGPRTKRARHDSPARDARVYYPENAFGVRSPGSGRVYYPENASTPAVRGPAPVLLPEWVYDSASEDFTRASESYAKLQLAVAQAAAATLDRTPPGTLADAGDLLPVAVHLKGFSQNPNQPPQLALQFAPAHAPAPFVASAWLAEYLVQSATGMWPRPLFVVIDGDWPSTHIDATWPDNAGDMDGIFTRVCLDALQLAHAQRVSNVHCVGFNREYGVDDINLLKPTLEKVVDRVMKSERGSWPEVDAYFSQAFSMLNGQQSFHELHAWAVEQGLSPNDRDVMTKQAAVAVDEIWASMQREHAADAFALLALDAGAGSGVDWNVFKNAQAWAPVEAAHRGHVHLVVVPDASVVAAGEDVLGPNSGWRGLSIAAARITQARECVFYGIGATSKKEFMLYAYGVRGSNPDQAALDPRNLPAVLQTDFHRFVVAPVHRYMTGPTVLQATRQWVLNPARTDSVLDDEAPMVIEPMVWTREREWQRYGEASERL